MDKQKYIDRRDTILLILLVGCVVLIAGFLGFSYGRDQQITQNIIINQDAEIKININTAPKSELMSIDGIGDTLANRIIEYRKVKKFESVYDLTAIKGISEEMVKKNERRLTVDE